MPPAARQVASDAWKRTLDGVVPAVVVLKVTQTRSFDTEAAGSSYATGFIVDKTRGIILTNRHVVTPGGALERGRRVALGAGRQAGSGSRLAVLLWVLLTFNWAT